MNLHQRVSSLFASLDSAGLVLASSPAGLAAQDLQRSAAPPTHTITNLGVEEHYGWVEGGYAVLGVAEQAQDLNGDGDTDDDVLHVYDTETSVLTNLGLAVDANGNWIGPANVTAAFVLFFVEESEQEADLNGDGDLADGVLHWHVFSSGVTVNLGLAGLFDFHLGERYAAFLVREGLQGSDLNADGDSVDSVLHLLDLQERSLHNLGIAGERLSAHEEWLRSRSSRPTRPRRT